MLLLAFGALGRAATRPASAQAVPPSVAVTASATIENAGGAVAGPPQDLLIQLTLDNQTGAGVSGLSLQSSVPANSAVSDSWLGRSGQQPGTAAGQQIRWQGLSIPAGAQLGPFAYRVAPAAGADGATIFLGAVVQPALSWDRQPAGAATPPSLPLNGLWGEDGLRRTVLPSGLTIFTQERPDTPTVALRLAARAGSRDEDDSTCGGSHWLEHAHFLGTTTRPDNQAVGGAISSVGGEFNASTGWEATSFWDLVPADKFSVAVDVLSDQMINSTFVPAAFEREKLVIIQEIKGRADSPSTHAFDDFMELVFKTSPLRQSPAATVCLLTLPVSSILAYRAQHYVTGSVAIAASGNLKHDDAVAMIAKAFAALPVGPWYTRRPVPEPVETDLRITLDGGGSGTATVRLGWPVGGINGPDWAPMSVLSDILGGTGTRLAQSTRDNALFATSIDADYLDFSDAGALMLTGSTDPGEVPALVQLYLDEIQRLRDGDVTAADVQASVTASAGARALDSELNLNQTDRAVEEASGALYSYDEALARLGAVTPADIQRVAQQYLDPSAYSLVIHRR